MLFILILSKYYAQFLGNDIGIKWKFSENVEVDVKINKRHHMHPDYQKGVYGICQEHGICMCIRVCVCA